MFSSKCDGAPRFFVFTGCNMIDSPSTLGDSDRNGLLLAGDLEGEAPRLLRGHRYVEIVSVTLVKRGMVASDFADTPDLRMRA